MTQGHSRTICWTSHWNKERGTGLEHLLLKELEADSVVLAFDEKSGPFRLSYHLTWDAAWRLRNAELIAACGGFTRLLTLHSAANGQWHYDDGRELPELEGCLDIDIWPTPFTNSFPIRRVPLALGERREFKVAWISAPELTVHPRQQAYTRLDERRYLFESLDGSGFKAELPVDEAGIVLDYPGLFRRVK